MSDTINREASKSSDTPKRRDPVDHTSVNHSNKKSLLSVMKQKSRELLLQRQKRKDFLHRIVTGDEKWIHYDNPKRRKSWGKPGHASTSSAKPNNAQASCCKTSKNLPGNA
ncbi:MOS1T transposase, partial [Pseudoatta argentina]